MKSKLLNHIQKALDPVKHSKWVCHPDCGGCFTLLQPSLSELVPEQCTKVVERPYNFPQFAFSSNEVSSLGQARGKIFILIPKV